MTSAQPQAGDWACFVIDRLPDVRDAAGWRGAQQMSFGLNQVARHTPAGTVITAYWSQNTSSIACVKY